MVHPERKDRRKRNVRRSRRTKGGAQRVDLNKLTRKWLDFVGAASFQERHVDDYSTIAEVEEFGHSLPEADDYPCHVMAEAAEETGALLDDLDGAAHDTMNTRLFYMAQLAAEGHRGFMAAASAVEDKYVEVVFETRDRGEGKRSSEEETRAEFLRSRDGALRILMGDDEQSGDLRTLCPCLRDPERPEDPHAVGHYAVWKGPEKYRQTDLGLAEHFNDIYKWDYCYLADQDTWLLWNGETWTRDRLGQIFVMAEKVGHRMYESVDRMREIADEDPETTDELNDRATKLAAFAGQAHEAPKIERLVKMTTRQEGVTRLHDAFDTAPDLLGVRNGVLELRTDGTVKLRPGARDDYVTRSTAVEYEPEAESEELEELLDTFVPDEELRHYLQKFMGYCLYGRNIERRIGFFLGASTSGKSTFLECVQKCLGDYGGPLNLAVFSGNMSDKPRPDVVDAKPYHFLGASELSSRTPLHAEQIKKIISNDTIPVRRMRADDFNKDPICFTPVIATNQVPTIPGADNGLKRRLVVFPWNEELTEDDPRWVEGKAEDLKGDEEFLTALFAWIVQGYALWRKEGLRDVPAIMQKEAEKFLAASDHFQDWLAGNFTTDADGWALTEEIGQSYETYCNEHSIPVGERYSHNRGLPAKLEDMGFRKGRERKIREKESGNRKSRKARYGYRFKTEAELKAEEE